MGIPFFDLKNGAGKETGFEPLQRVQPEASIPAVTEGAPERDITHRDASRADQREFFKVLRRNIVEKNETTGEYELRYYGSDSPNSEARVPLKELKTDHSLDDDGYKYSLVWFYCTFIAVICSSPKLEELALLLGGDKSKLITEAIIFFVVALCLGIYFATIRTVIITNFVGVDAMWTNAIDQIFSQDVRVRMDGVRDCMLKFRQFIKWRRWANFFLGICYVLAPVVIASVIGITIFLGMMAIEEVLVMGLLCVGLVASIRWFVLQRAEHTDWRDPTVQLCVAMAEMHRRYVESRIINESRVQ